MFFSPSFHVPNYASWRVTSVPSPRPSSGQFIKWLSLVRWPMLLLVATSSACANLQTGGGGGPSSYMGYPPSCAPGGVGRKPCGQGPPSMRPDRAGVVKATDDEDDDDNEEDDGTSTERWVSGSAWVFLSCFLGPFGPLVPVIPMLGFHGQPLFFPWPIPDPGILSVPLILGTAPNFRSGFTSRQIPSPSTSAQWSEIGRKSAETSKTGFLH
jgi:hypothetical protein